MVAVISVVLTQEDESAAPFHCTGAPFSKFEPNKTKLTANVPAVVLEGAIAVSAGITCGVSIPPPPLVPAPPPQPTRKRATRTPGSINACRAIIHTRTAI